MQVPGEHFSGQQTASGHTGLVSRNGNPLQVGLGAGATSDGSTNANAPAAVCLNPLDATCWLQNAAQWMAQQVMGALQPVIGAIMHNPLNILTQTPPADTYQNPTVITWWNAFLAVVDLALASLIVIGGYNVVVGRHLGLPHSELAEFLPRLLLAFGAAHFSLFFLGLFIDLENALNVVALNLAGTSMLTNIITALFQGNLAAEGLAGVGADVRAGGDGDPARRADGGAPGAPVGLAGARWAGTGLLCAPANDRVRSHVALAHRHDGHGAVLPGGDAGPGRDARDLAGCLQRLRGRRHPGDAIGVRGTALPGLAYPRHRASLRPAPHDGCLESSQLEPPRGQ